MNSSGLGGVEITAARIELVRHINLKKIRKDLTTHEVYCM
jgi:hypothetical protein